MMNDTPETDQTASYEGNWEIKALRMTAKARSLERERDKAMEIVRAVAHIGVDFGHGEYELSDDYIKTARELLSGDSPTENDQ